MNRDLDHSKTSRLAEEKRRLGAKAPPSPDFEKGHLRGNTLPGEAFGRTLN
jgi:hypothetical protein